MDTQQFRIDGLPLVRQFVADRIHVAGIRRLARREFLLSKLNTQVQVDALTDSLLISLDTYLDGITNHKISIHKRWPRTWWDALKDRWFPSWAKTRWPPQYDSIDIDQPLYLAVCPHLYTEPQGSHLEWLAAEQLRHEAER